MTQSKKRQGHIGPTCARPQIFRLSGMKNPVGRPPGLEKTSQPRAEILFRQQQGANLVVQRSYRQRDIDAIQMRHHRHGMSRAALVRIYGRDTVDQALAQASK